MSTQPLPILAPTATATLCLVHTPCVALRDDRLEPPLGLLYVLGYAGSHGHRTALADLTSKPLESVEAHVPEGFTVYGFSTYSVNYSLTLKIARAIRRRNPQAMFVAGGPHATALPQSVHDDGFDVVVTGEGEASILQILQAIDRGEALPSFIRGTGVDDLDSLPFPDYRHVDLGSYTREVAGKKCVSILSSRGCPYPCSFCNSNIMGAGKPMRFRSPRNVISEIQAIKETHGINHFRFQDDIFTLSVKRVRELAPHLAAEGIEYRCFARINTFSEEMAELLASSGCCHVSFGVESGSEKLLAKHAMHKKQTPAQIEWALNNAARAELRSRIFLIVGFPGETDETVNETIDLVKRCPWDEFAVYPLIAYPGTPLHDHPARFGITYIDKNYSDYLQIGKNFKAGFTIRTAEFDEHQVRVWRDRMIEALLKDDRTWAGDSKGFK